MNPMAGPDLRDIHLPPPPPWWPPAPGWWILGILVLIAASTLLWISMRAWRRRRWRCRVHAEWQRIATGYATQPDAVRVAAEISQLLRRATLLIDRPAAAYQGERWLAFLDTQLGSNDFTQGLGRVLIDAPFRRSTEFDAPALLTLSRRWLEKALRTHNDARSSFLLPLGERARRANERVKRLYCHPALRAPFSQSEKGKSSEPSHV